MFEDETFYFYTACEGVAGTFSFDEDTIDFRSAEGEGDPCTKTSRQEFNDRISPLIDGEFQYEFDGSDLVLEKDGVRLRFFSG